MQRGKSQSQRATYGIASFYEMSSTGEFLETESRLVVPRTEEWGGHLEKH